ncbi:alpha-N-arabinofuranosidase [Mucilaginibacter rubeus]|uniref:non-reducing end alpha-L-arabinofuranosidase n=1 Tax=Mucilaginibacter rubeus TaxID=2027860 RepID=A0AAE6JDR6_9SPHI|nr:MULTISPECIES: alpha-L-arabinofuranosidase C-terminal domain-containing protein [Mucilaginibacter]QEM03240.1 alpha-N-arabinofuranosidase [Mucilaginibacter rubeus]QEM15858.1 alpha-N-arabinofuranosidase [Mucilaginibacter gossypii]QTE41403.1 alpha-N-arabinofuranosidase [Mucilaginibacter rubeus]QTE48006.1 alpha-N-arabinofuranosidase [Mucilaginibacter rubeus]QTE59400.1 alpha-N-arabinofuranosidase [Mucilaginibacter rubeus]
MKKNPFLQLGVIALSLLSSASFGQTGTLNISTDSKTTISKHIYGQFAEHLGHGIYGGFWVDKTLPVKKQDRIRLDIVDALKKIKIPNLRWPGGCFADEYHWRDGIGPATARPRMVNTNWGGITEDNSFGTHEFLELCDLLGCEPYIAGNVGSGTVDEMSKWIEYLNSNSSSTVVQLRKKNGHPAPYKVTYWGVGNESWGCGGNMTPEYYSDLFKRYASFAKDYPGAKLKKIASGPNSDDYRWTEVCMKNISSGMMAGLSLHYYTIPTGNWGKKGSATNFDEKEYFSTMVNCLKMEELVTKHSAIMDKYDPEKKVALVVDEWGVWTDPEPGTNPGFLYQQNSLRDALIAGTTLNIFNNHSGRVKMAALAQTINVLQALILTDKEKMVLTPTYHVFDMYKVHQDAKYLPIKLSVPDYEVDGKKIEAVNASASQDAAGKVHISLVNLDPHNTITITTGLSDIKWQTVSGQVLTSAKLTDVNTFKDADKIHLNAFTGAKKDGDKLVVSLPAKSIVTLELK